jgi:hypothetical protein
MLVFAVSTYRRSLALDGGNDHAMARLAVLAMWAQTRSAGVVLLLIPTALLAMAAAPVPVDPKSTAPLGDGGRIPVLLMSGSDSFHDWRRTTPQLRAMLEESGHFDVRVVEDAEALAASTVTSRYRVIILNGQTPSASARLRRNLTRYVKRGGGLVAIHWAVDNFRSWPGFTAILGRSWQEGRSVEEHGRFHIQPASDSTNPIIAGMQPWDTVEGEAVHYRLRGDGPVDVLATAPSLTTSDIVPVMIAHRYGRGRTFFTPLGHSFAARADPHWKAMITHAVEWTATGSVRFP